MVPHKYTKYAEDVVAGRVTAGQHIILACQRYLSWFQRPELYFDADRIERIENFLRHIKHFEGEFNGKSFYDTLLDWQVFVLCNIFGWYRADDHSKRVIRNVFLLISRKNGKSALSAAIMLADMIVGGEAGYEGYLVANNREQARILFKFLDGFARSIDPRQKFMKRLRDCIIYHKTNAKLAVLSSDSMGNDGYNPSSFCVDEFAAARDYSNYNILKSGQAMRKNPLSITISSAGFLLDTYPCYEQCKVGLKTLRGEVKDDSWFYAIYQLDEGDDYKDPNVWTKACPSFPNIVQKDYMEERITEAYANSAKLTDVKTKNFNMWCAASNAWFDTNLLMKCDGKVELDRLKGETAYMGVDLSATRDLTAVALMFPPNPYRDYHPQKYLFKLFIWIPQYAVRNSENSGLYEWYIDSGQAVMTPGNAVDYSVVLTKLKELHNDFNIVKVSYDQWNASMFTQAAIAEGFNMEPFGQGLGSFNRPTKTFELIICNEQCICEFQPILLWMFNHCELKIDHMENCKPIKAGDNKANKIDGIIAILEALGGYLLDYLQNGSAEVISLNLGEINSFK